MEFFTPSSHVESPERLLDIESESKRTPTTTSFRGMFEDIKEGRGIHHHPDTQAEHHNSKDLKGNNRIGYVLLIYVLCLSIITDIYDSPYQRELDLCFPNTKLCFGESVEQYN